MWGKILGALFGMALFKWPGLFLGLMVGHWFDRSVLDRRVHDQAAPQDGTSKQGQSDGIVLVEAAPQDGKSKHGHCDGRVKLLGGHHFPLVPQQVV